MKQFKTESRKILDLVINSIYSNRDVFLRELISNASDAIDKVVLRALESGSEPPEGRDLEIELSFDVDARTITVSENGIGMSAAELEENLGTIAHSSSLELKRAQEAAAESGVDIIGQFGVGFYSAFMVADEVSVVSRALGGDEAFRWTSDGVEGYTVEPAERASHGTDVTLHLRENAGGVDYGKFLSHPALAELVKRYSDYIRYPIVMEVSGRREVPAPEGARVWEPVFEDYTERKVLNSMTPIWTKMRSEVAPEEYDEFYMKEFDDPNPPLRTISMHARGQRSCDVLLFIPSEPTADFYSNSFQKGLELYSSNVMIMERCGDLLDEAFGFVRGIVDSPDVSLNLSRESMVEDEVIKAIASQVKKRVTFELETMRDNERELYAEFFGKFGRIFKFAIYATFGAKNEQLEDLLLFYTANRDEPVTLREYRDAMPAGQRCIFFASGDAARKLEASPSVKAVTQRGYDVLLCDESVDEFCLMTLRTYDGVEIKNVTAGDLGLEDAYDVAFTQNANAENRKLLEAMRDALGEEAVEVSVSSRLSTVPASISASGPISLGMEKYFASLPEDSGAAPQVQHVLELNPNDPIFATLQKASESGDDETVARYAVILYGQALLAEGLPVKDLPAYAQAVYALM